MLQVVVVDWKGYDAETRKFPTYPTNRSQSEPRLPSHATPRWTPRHRIDDQIEYTTCTIS